MMKKLSSLALICLLSCLCAGLLACGSGSSSPPPPESQPQPEPEPQPQPEPEPEPQPEPEPEPEPQPQPQPVPVINSSPDAAMFWPGNNGGQPVGELEVVDVQHEAFSRAAQITVNNPGGEFWNGQLTFPVNSAVQAGDVVLVHLFIRSIENTYETGSGFATVFLEDNTTYEKYISREVSAAEDWEEYFLPAEVTDNQPVGNLSLKIGFGAGDRPQVFEIAGVELLNYGDYDITLLPATLPSYGGREPDAAWRAAAAERIELHRKGDFSITVLDGEGSPVNGAVLDIDFQKHAYHFGSVTVGHILAGSDSISLTYKEKVLELFNQSGPENDLKWPPWAGEWGSNFNQTQTLAGLQWLRDNGLYTRGHVMVWPSKRNLPNLIQAYLPEGAPENADPAAKQIVLDHIDDIASATRDYLDEWDVLNEPYDNHYLMDAFGNEVMVDWFNRARMHLPTHGLYLNDYSILSAGGRNTAHHQHFEDTARYLLDNEAPLTGLGMQSHFDASPTDIPLVYSILERFHSAFPNLDIRSTEFDIRTTDESMQADYTRDFLTIFFSHPATVGVQLWGFWAGAHHAPEAAMYDLDWREKPNALAWKDLIYTQWWNNFDGATDTNGDFSARGFYGDYSLTVTVGESSQTYEFTLSAGQTNAFEFTFAE